MEQRLSTRHDIRITAVEAIDTLEEWAVHQGAKNHSVIAGCFVVLRTELAKLRGERETAGWVVRSMWGRTTYSLGRNVWGQCAYSVRDAHKYATREEAVDDRDAWRARNGTEAARCINVVRVTRKRGR